MPSSKELLVFLFDDFLLLSIVKTPVAHWQSLLFEPKSNLHLKLYRSVLVLADIILASELPTDPFTFAITTTTREKPFMFKTAQTNIRYEEEAAERGRFGAAIVFLSSF